MVRSLKTIRLILTFYQSFWLASFLINICCIEIFWQHGMQTFSSIFWFKLITFALIVYFIRQYKAKEFPYYQNLGISLVQLWATTILFDFSLFIFLIVMTYKIR